MSRLIRIWALTWGLAAMIVYTANYMIIRRFGRMSAGFARTRWVRWLERWVEPLFLLGVLLALLASLTHDVWTGATNWLRKAGS